MGGFGQFAGFVALLTLVVIGLSVFAVLGTAIAKFRQVPVSIGALYGALLGPVGAFAVLVLPRRILVGTTERYSEFSMLEVDSRLGRTISTEVLEDPYV